MTLDDLEAQRAALVDDDQLPAATTRGELLAHQAKRAALDRRIWQAKEAQSALDALPSAGPLRLWREQQTAWRETLVAELFTIKSPCRDKQELGRRNNLQLSLKVIDRGLQHIADTGYELTTLRLGALMIEAGYAVAGADPERHYAGALPWFGSIPEVERHLKDLDARRARLQAALDGLLQDDGEREKQEAEATALRDAFNQLRVKVGPDTAEPRLVAYDAHGDVLPADRMTVTQRRAFEAADAAFRAEQRREQPVTT